MPAIERAVGMPRFLDNDPVPTRAQRRRLPVRPLGAFFSRREVRAVGTYESPNLILITLSGVDDAGTSAEAQIHLTILPGEASATWVLMSVSYRARATRGSG